MDANLYCDAQRNGYSHAHGDAHANADGYAFAHADADTYPYSYGDAHADGDCDPHGDRRDHLCGAGPGLRGQRRQRRAGALGDYGRAGRDDPHLAERSLVATAVTDGSGAYNVPGLPAGATIVEELQPPGYVSTTPDNVALNLTGDVAVDFGEQPLVATPTPTATPIPVTMELRATYRYLLWYGPITQVLTGRYVGPAPLGGRTVLVTYRVPWGGFGVASTTTAAGA